MPKIIRIGGSTYREVERTTRKPYKRRYSPKRDSSTFFKSPAQKAYESRKNLEYVRNKRHLENAQEEYRKEHKQRKQEASIRRKERLHNIHNKAKSFYNKDIHIPHNIRNPFKRKQKSTQPYGGFESARRTE